MKKTGIEQFLTWAFTQELCKVGSGGAGLSSVGQSNWGITRDMAVLGTLIDKSPNAYGVIPGFIEDGAPHPDAVVAGDVVRALASRGFDIPEGWHPFPEWHDEHGVIAAEVARVVAETRLKGDRLSGRHVVNLVTSAAILNRGPDWTADRPAIGMVMQAGKPAWFVRRQATDAFGRIYEYEIDGRDKVKHRPKAGAYRKYELQDPIRGAILSRLDWQLWQDALALLAESLRGRLCSHELLPFYPFRQPWALAAAL